MKYHLLVLAILITFSWRCKSEYENKEVYSKAIRISAFLTEERIKNFYEWNYEMYPNFEGWKKNCPNKIPYSNAWHSCTYNCLYYKGIDTLRIGFSIGYKWHEDFPIAYIIDTGKYDAPNFCRQKNGRITIEADLKDSSPRKTVILDSNLLAKNVFKEHDPFRYFNELENLVDSMGIVKSKYDSQLGNFIQFYITPTEILTYLPANYKIESVKKEMFEKEFERSFHINSHWNLRKVALSKHQDIHY